MKRNGTREIVSTLHSPPSTLHALVLDVDGTIVNCRYDFDAMRAATAHLAAEYGVSADDLEVKGVLEQIDAVAARLGPDADQFRRRAEQAIQQLEVTAAASASFFPGACEALEALRARGLALALITRNCRRVSARVLAGCDCYDVLLARDDVPHPKPDPDHVWRALACLGKSPAQTVMVGDHAFDMQAGRAAGVQLCVGVRTGGSRDARLQEAGADAVLESLAALPAWWAEQERGRE